MLLNGPDGYMTPFLKWPGGKRWFIHHYARLLPTEFDRYMEPFLGGGSVFFHLAPVKAVLADTNEELITTYRAIRDDWAKFLVALTLYNEQHSGEHYYRVRASRPTCPAVRAARMIYLNRTCFNGIYRVSQRGDFNVPKGTRASVLRPTDNFEGVAKLLSSSDLRVSDFEAVIDGAGAGDLVFADPPYTVNHNNNGFMRYNEKLFSWADQKRLAAALTRAHRRGAMVVATNADHESVKKLYWGNGFRLRAVERASFMSCNAASRRHFKEVIIRANCGGK
jgi:DNA adenine methylase